MKTLYIHIGTPKTGTSTLQHFFKKNCEILLKSGVYYPKGMEYSKWGGTESTAGNFAWITRIKKTQEEIKTYILELFEHADNVLLSSEHIWTEVSQKDVFFGMLKDISDEIEIKVIVFLRPQIDYLESQYREYVRIILADQKFEDIYKMEVPYLEEIKYLCHYNLQLMNIGKVIGIDNVIVKIFQKECFKHNSIIEEFLSILKLELTEEYCIDTYNYNPSMNATFFEIKRIMNSTNYLSQEEMNVIFYDILMKYGTEKSKNAGVKHFETMLSKEQRDEFMQAFAEENRELAQVFLKRNDLFFNKDNVQDAHEQNTLEIMNLLEGIIKIYTAAITDLHRQKDNTVANLNKQLKDTNDLIDIKSEENKARVDSIGYQMKINNLEYEKRFLELESSLKKCLMVEKELEWMKNSKSWKVTAPLRKAVELFRKVKKLVKNNRQ